MPDFEIIVDGEIELATFHKRPNRFLVYLKPDITNELESKAKFFKFEEDQMYSQRENELLQQYMQKHGKMPGGGDDELDDLF